MALNLTKAAITVLEKRYLKKDETGVIIETPEELFKRVVSNIAEAELKYDGSQKDVEYWKNLFYKTLTNLDFLPSSPVLFNAGTHLQQLNACFVLPITDTLSNGEDGILDILRSAALIHKTGGGTGFDFSDIRPANSIVGKTGGVASGPVTFLKAYDSVTDVIKQGGKRRGANIGILRCDHPDIFEFISCKEKEGEISNFNISIAITNDFMDAIASNSSWKLTWQGVIYKIIKARDLWEKLIEGAWKNGEPGVVFIDTANKYNNIPSLGDYKATNPCSELWLTPWESCNLGSINLSTHYDTKTNSFNREKLKETVRVGIRFLDNVIDMNKLPLSQIEVVTKKLRRVGLGIMGWADLLIKMKVRYGTEESFIVAKEVSQFIRDEAYRYSEQLAQERGAFPYFDSEPLLKGSTPRRNVTLLSVAPTGTLSMIAGCSSSIEPVFSFDMNKNVLDSSIDMSHPLYMQWMRENKKEALPDYFVSALDIPYDQHIKMQSIFQEYIDSSISKTINLSKNAAIEDVEKAYILAWELGCKGVTVYRDGSREVQVLVSKKGLTKSSAQGRPKKLKGITSKFKTGEGTAYITVNEHNEKLFEVFVQIGKSGKDTSANSEAIGRLVSLCLRSNVTPEDIIRQLSDITGNSPTWNEDQLIKSIPDAVATMLSECIGNGKVEEKPVSEVACPECGKSAVIFEEGCFKCLSCSYTKCGG